MSSTAELCDICGETVDEENRDPETGDHKTCREYQAYQYARGALRDAMEKLYKDCADLDSKGTKQILKKILAVSEALNSGPKKDEVRADA